MIRRALILATSLITFYATSMVHADTTEIRQATGRQISPFTTLDLDNNGILDSKEVKRGDARVNFRAMDRDRDQKISRDEYSRYYYSDMYAANS